MLLGRSKRLGSVETEAIEEGYYSDVRVASLPGLEMATAEEALKRGKAEDDGAINRWLIEQFSS